MTHPKPTRGLILAAAALITLGACDQPPDWDLRDLGGDGLDTSSAARSGVARPEADARGVISYPTYQVAMARRGDTVRIVAGRLGLNADDVARYNGLSADAQLREGELIAIPGSVGAGAAGAGSGTGTGSGINVTTLAGDAINRAGSGTTGATTGSGSGTATATASGQPFAAEPIRHRVQRGETIYTISRLYGVDVRTIAEWNRLPADLTVREGQFLFLPNGPGSQPPANIASTNPGQGSPTPVPPSASTPTPSGTARTAPATPPAAPDIGQANAGNSSAPLIYPVDGTIIRAYSRGRNEGIDISAPAGTSVKAAAAGVVAAVTRDTNNVAVVVIRHDNNLLTVYTNLDNLTVQKDSRVTRGQVIGKVRAAATPFLHFEVREGLESVDPADYLP